MNDSINLPDYKLIKKVPNEGLEMLCGKLLGDGNILIQAKRTPRFRFSHSVKDKEWCFYCYKELSVYFPLNSPRYRKITDKRVNAGFTEMYYVQSKTSLVFKELKKLWYPDNKKVLPIKLLYHVMSPLCLAWWYQDDGNLKIGNGIPNKITLSTDSFSYEENHFLIQLLQSKFGLSFSLDGQNRLLLYDRPQIFYFLSIVRPYILMKRKMWIPLPANKFFPKFKRTTIYLSKQIRINKPTYDINQQLTILPRLNEILDSDKTYQLFYQKYIIPLKQSVTNSYQIRINQKSLIELDKCQKRTGLKISEIVELCYLLNKYKHNFLKVRVANNP
ncbi:endonuclease [Fictibacillus sp. Mic-4]|uniref:endonuclease n=1 Tax=Fictibacillus sp. Mic-4 TaxID=3132826 RepID=UPI003CF5CD8F